MSKLKEYLARWYRSEAAVGKYGQALLALEDTGALNLLRRMGVPTLINNGSDVNATAAQAAWSNGYQTCLDHIETFVTICESYNKKPSDQTSIVPDFGGLREAVSKGDLTAKEAALLKGKI